MKERSIQKLRLSCQREGDRLRWRDSKALFVRREKIRESVIDYIFMTSNARPYEMSHKRNDFVNAKTTVGTIINRPNESLSHAVA